MRDLKVSVQTLPSFSDMTDGKVTISDIRELDLDELLARDLLSQIKYYWPKLSPKKLLWSLAQAVRLEVSYVGR